MEIEKYEKVSVDSILFIKVLMQMVTAAMKLKDAYSLEENLLPT